MSRNRADIKASNYLKTTQCLSCNQGKVSSRLGYNEMESWTEPYVVHYMHTTSNPLNLQRRRVIPSTLPTREFQSAQLAAYIEQQPMPSSQPKVFPSPQSEIINLQSNHQLLLLLRFPSLLPRTKLGSKKGEEVEGGHTTNSQKSCRSCLTTFPHASHAGTSPVLSVPDEEGLQCNNRLFPNGWQNGCVRYFVSSCNEMTTFQLMKMGKWSCHDPI